MTTLSVRRALGVVGVGAIAAAGLVVIGAAPASAEPNGYTTVANRSEQGCRLETIDLADGSHAPIGDGAYTEEACVGDLAFTLDGTLYGIGEVSFPEPSFVQLVRFDLSTGEPIVVGTIREQAAIVNGGLTVAPDGRMYGMLFSDCAGAPCLYLIPPDDPEAATVVGTVTSGDNLTVYTGIATSCADETYTYRNTIEGAALETGSDPLDSPSPFDDATPSGDDVGAQANLQELTNLNLATAEAPAVGDVGEDRFVYGLDFDTAGALWGIGNAPGGNFIYNVDPATGAASFGPEIDAEGDEIFLTLAIDHPCTQPEPEPEPVVLAPTFTG